MNSAQIHMTHDPHKRVPIIQTIFRRRSAKLWIGGWGLAGLLPGQCPLESRPPGSPGLKLANLAEREVWPFRCWLKPFIYPFKYLSILSSSLWLPHCLGTISEGWEVISLIIFLTIAEYQLLDVVLVSPENFNKIHSQETGNKWIKQWKSLIQEHSM